MTRLGMPPAAYARYASSCDASGNTAPTCTSKVALVDQSGELGQLGAVGLVDEDDCLDVARSRQSPNWWPFASLNPAAGPPPSRPTEVTT